MEQPSRPGFDEVLAGLTEAAPTPEQLAAASPGERIALLARSVEGLGAESTPEGMLGLYLDTVCPERTAFAASSIYRDVNYWRAASGCGLVARSVLRRMGVRSPHIGLEAGGAYRSYAVGTAVSSIVQAAIDQGAWNAEQDVPPLGAIVVIGTGLATHVLLVVQEIEIDMICESIDGGQVQSAEGKLQLQCILRRRRKITRSGGKLFHEGRVQIGYVDPERLQPSDPPTPDLI